MADRVSPTVAAIIAARTSAVIEAALRDLTTADSEVLPHLLHQHAGTLASYDIPVAGGLRRLEAELARGADEDAVRRELALLTDELAVLLATQH